MSTKRTLTGIVTALALLASCSRIPEGTFTSYQGRIDNAEVTLYTAKNKRKSDRMEVTIDGITWIYVDTNQDGRIDYAERRQGDKVFIYTSVDDSLDLFQKVILDKATNNYKAMLKAIQQRIGSELDSR